MLRLLAMPGLLLSASTASAFYRSEPNDPKCPALGKFDSTFDFETCRLEMESDKRDVQACADCLDKAKSDTLDSDNRAAKRFNCAASGDRYCF